LNNLDKILKQQMENFAPDAPNIWAGIEQGIQNNAVTQTATLSKTVGSKLIVTIVKIAAFVIIPASVIVYVVGNSNSNPTENNKVENNISSPIITKPDEIKTIEPLNIKAVEVETKSSTKQQNKSKHLKDKSTLVRQESIEKAIVITNIPSIAEPIITSNKSEHTKTIITPKPTFNYQIEENDLEKKIVLDVDNNETNNKTIASQNDIGIKTLPNMFSPNNDGINDKYVIDLEGENYYNLKIYNLNYDLVFESNEKNTNWDGINFKNGQACNSGTYYGILRYKLNNSDKSLTRMTQIKLIR
jgi:gliding motility-associated-like protein